MTKKEIIGKYITLIIMTILIILELGIVTIFLISDKFSLFPKSIISLLFLLRVVLYISIYRGSEIAKWLFILLSSLGTYWAIITREDFIVIRVLIDLVIIGLLLTPFVTAYQNYKRNLSQVELTRKKVIGWTIFTLLTVSCFVGFTLQLLIPAMNKYNEVKEMTQLPKLKIVSITKDDQVFYDNAVMSWQKEVNVELSDCINQLLKQGGYEVNIPNFIELICSNAPDFSLINMKHNQYALTLMPFQMLCKGIAIDQTIYQNDDLAFFKTYQNSIFAFEETANGIVLNSYKKESRKSSHNLGEINPNEPRRRRDSSDSEGEISQRSRSRRGSRSRINRE